jgi:gluconolactonase
MKSIGMFTIALGVLGATFAWGQQAPARRTGPGVQAPQDAREPEVLKECKVPPPAFGAGRGAGRGPARGPAAEPAGDRQYTVTEIPGVIAAGQKWKEVWQATGNNADGIIASDDGGLLIAQNDNSDVVKLNKDGKASVIYKGTNTGGSLSRNKKGVLFIVNRGLRASIDELAPKRRVLANKYQGEPLDCLGGVLNDLTADSNGGVYFTMGVVFHVSPKGVITKYGENLRTNGIILSPDEKTLYVTNGPSVVAFDVQKDGSLTNQREFAKLQGNGFGGDGSTVDAAGRLYVTSNPGIQVIGPDGKNLGLIPTPRGVISTAFSGPDKKTLYAVIFTREEGKTGDRIISIPMIAQGYKGRAK